MLQHTLLCGKQAGQIWLDPSLANLPHNMVPNYKVSDGADFNIALWKARHPDASPEKVLFSFADNGQPAPVLAWNYGDEFLVFTATDGPPHASTSYERRVHQHMSTMAQIMLIPQSYVTRGHRTCAQFALQQAMIFMNSIEDAMEVVTIQDNEDTLEM